MGSDFRGCLIGEVDSKMNMMRRLKSIASGRSSVSDPVMFFSIFCLYLFFHFCIAVNMILAKRGRRNEEKELVFFLSSL